jgi:hypothetical protein
MGKDGQSAGAVDQLRLERVQCGKLSFRPVHCVELHSYSTVSRLGFTCDNTFGEQTGRFGCCPFYGQRNEIYDELILIPISSDCCVYYR